MMARTLLLLLLLLTAASCQSGKDEPGLLLDRDIIPVGSSIEFWIYTDADGEDDEEDVWHKSNIHIRNLPRPMTGAEARIWAGGVGQRDADNEWTHYYVLVTHPGPEKKTFRSPVTSRTIGYDRSARLQTPR